MIPMTLAEIATATETLAPPGAENITVTSVEFDSRRVNPGALFIALVGEHVDGHDFAADAAAAGAVAVLGARAVDALPSLVAPVWPATSDNSGPQRSPVLAALSALAHHVATRLADRGLTIVGVTGSAGKTSTKDLIAAVLSRAGRVVAPPESFNNELGHPYTVLQADETTRFLVLELSARGIGHIAALARIAPPRIGAVLNVGSAHLGEFGSRAAIAAAKGELVEALPSAAAGGVAILNSDDDRVLAMAKRTAAAVVRTGMGGAADVRAANVSIDGAARASFELVTPEGSNHVRLAVVGAHQVTNALVAAAVGRAVGMGVDDIAQALSAAGPASRWRMEVTELPGGVTVINDAYNANPESMRAALDALRRIDATGARWAVLGEMAELGNASAAEHRELGRFAAGAGVAVVAVGDRARSVYEGALAAYDDRSRPRPLWFADLAAAEAGLFPLVHRGDAVLVKASRAVGLERFAAHLIEALPSMLADSRESRLHSEERP